MRAIALAALLAAGPAAAQQAQWTPAPVPSVAPADAVSPAARAGLASGTDNSAPRSGIPTGALVSGGTTSANTTEGVGTPSLSR